MNSSPARFDPSAEDQAAFWAARLDGGVLTADQRVELEAWLAASPSHRTLLAQFCQLSADLEEQLPALVDSGIIALPAASPPGRRIGRFKLAAAGSLAAIAAAVVLAVWFAKPRTQREDFATPLAQRQSLELVDGSHVDLDANTTLHVEIANGRRQVRLATGEAFFQVAKDPERPFIVDTPAGAVRVTGTKFDVRAEGSPALAVTVVEGQVQVRPGAATDPEAAPVNLVRGDRLTSEDHRVTVETLSVSALEDAVAWRRGEVVFKGTPLREALARFARYQGRGMNATPGAAELRVGGRFSLDDPDGFLTALEEILPVRVMRDLNGAVQVRLRSEP